jgi:hypothetical protein
MHGGESLNIWSVIVLLSLVICISTILFALHLRRTLKESARLRLSCGLLALSFAILIALLVLGGDNAKWIVALCSVNLCVGAWGVAQGIKAERKKKALQEQKMPHD